MKKIIFIILCLANMLFAQDQVNLKALYEKAYFLETVQRDLQKSFTVYEAILALKPQDELAAQCHLRIAEIYRKKNKSVLAKSTYQRILKDFAAQKEICAQVQQKLREHYGAADSTASLLDKIKNTKITIEFEQTPMKEFVHFLAKTTDINIVLSERINDPIVLKMKDVTVKNLLDALARLGFSYKIWNGIVIIGNLPVEWGIDKTFDSVPVITQEKEDYLRNNLLTLELLETPSQEFFDTFAKTLNLNIIIAKEAQEKKISLSLKNVSAKNILHIACSLINCRYHYRDSILVIDHEDNYNSGIEGLHGIQLEFTYDHPPVENKRFTVITYKNVGENGSKTVENDSYILEKKSNNQYTVPLDFSFPFEISVVHPGYYSQKKVVKEHGKIQFAMKAKKRQLSFYIHNRKNQKAVLAKKVVVNGKKALFGDVFSPGEKLEIYIECKGYKPFTTTVVVVPGKGPFIIDVPVDEN